MSLPFEELPSTVLGKAVDGIVAVMRDKDVPIAASYFDCFGVKLQDIPIIRTTKQLDFYSFFHQTSEVNMDIIILITVILLSPVIVLRFVKWSKRDKNNPTKQYYLASPEDIRSVSVLLCIAGAGSIFFGGFYADYFHVSQFIELGIGLIVVGFAVKHFVRPF